MPFIIVRNDITRMKVDAIVNAANRSLLGGGGVDGAIHRAAGPELLAECRTLGGCETGEAKITGGYRLPARYVIHTVGPVWHGGGEGEQEKLRSCYRKSLELAVKNGCETIAFPLISAGAYGYPRAEAIDTAAETITGFLEDHEITAYLVLFGAEEFRTGKNTFRDVQEYIDDFYAGSRINRSTETLRERLWHRNEKKALDLDRRLGSGYAPAAAPSPAEEGTAVRLEDVSAEAADAAYAPAGKPDWEELLRRTDESFSQALIRLIDERGMTDAECYRRANVDRKLFSKIRSNPAYRPSKPTAFAFAVALKLSLRETEKLLRKAGYAISHSSRFDIIVEYFIRHQKYNIYEINEVLFQFDMPLLGSGMGM